MKGKKLYINVEMDNGGKVVINVDDLKEALKDVMRSKLDKVKIGFTNGDEKKKYYLHIDLPYARKLIKLSNIMNKPIVPKTLTKYLVDLSEKYALKDVPKMVGRDEEIEKIWFYLSQKSKNNVFIIGEADVGKTRIVREIARQIATNECPKEFYEHRILLLKPDSLLNIDSDKKYKNVIKQILKVVKNNRENLIIYIDKTIYMKYDIDLLLVLYCFIRRYNVPVIMTLRTDDFVENFLDDSVLEKYENIVEVGEPEYEEIYPMIKNRVKGIQKKYNIEISEKMTKFAIFTSSLMDSISSNIGKSLNTIERACVEAIISDKDAVDKKCILKCYDSYKKMYDNMGIDEIRRIAYHETGHFLTLLKSKNIQGVKTLCVSILPMMDFLGVNMSYSLIGKDLNVTREYMVDYIAMLLGGRVAESKLTQNFSAGASSDLESANQKAEEVVMRYALCDSQRTYYSGDIYVKTYLLTDEEKNKINNLIKSILDEAYKRAEQIIEENFELLKFIVEKLINEEVLTGEELEEMIADFENKN